VSSEGSEREVEGSGREAVEVEVEVGARAMGTTGFGGSVLILAEIKLNIC